MIQFGSLNRTMETRDHSKKRASLKSLISSSKVLIVAMLFLPVTLAAQITFAEKPQEKGPGWEYMRDIIMMPYDSTQLLIETYPILEAYRKYIGQQIFFMEGSDSDENVIHKYYEIIDVISYKNFLETELTKIENESTLINDDLDEMQNFFDANVSNQRKERVTYMIKQNYFFPCEDNPDSQCRYEIKDEDIPYFVLKNTQTKDTIYRTITTINYANRDKNDSNTYRAKDYDHGVILVGGFIKVKKDAVGKNFIFWRHSGGLDPEIGSIWECIDVSITKEISYLNFYDDKHSYSRDEKKHEIVSLTLRNNKKPDLIDHVRYSHITQRVGNHIIGSTSSTITSEKTFKEHELAFNRRKQDYNNLVAQEKAKLKQQLTAKYGAANADKIIAGKFEIGMSKAVCKEIAGYATVVDKTTTAETWKVSNFWTGSVTYLYFSGDKLARIVNR